PASGTWGQGHPYRAFHHRRRHRQSEDAAARSQPCRPAGPRRHGRAGRTLLPDAPAAPELLVARGRMPALDRTLLGGFMPGIQVNGETLHYIAEGTGPVIMFVHSLGANSYMWRPIMDKLKDEYCCIAVDCRGHGKSTYKNTFTIRDVAADMNAVLDEL